MKGLLITLLLAAAFAQPLVFGQVKKDSTNSHDNAMVSWKGITIHQEVDVKASPQAVYKALLDTKQFSEFSGMSALIDPAVGGTFSVFNNHIIGRNLELIPNQRIV